MDIYEIKELTRYTAPRFFDYETLKFFGQDMESFDVEKQQDGRFRISAPIIDSQGKRMGQTVRYFNPKTKCLDRE